MRLTVHDHAMIHTVAILSRDPAARGRVNDPMFCRVLAEVMPGVSRKAPEMTLLVTVADMLAGSRGDPAGLSDMAARAMLGWDRVRLGQALDVIRGRA